MSKPVVFVARQIPEVGLRMLADQCDVRLHSESMPPTREQLLRGVQDCEGILSLLSDRIDAEVMDSAGSKLRVISNFAVGFNNIDVAEARKRGILVGNTPDVLTDATADLAVALLLGCARRLLEGNRDVREGGWKTWEPMGWIGHDLCGKTLGIVGMGRIGQAVARRLHGGWGMRVLYTSREAKPQVDTELGAQHVALDDLLKESDFVSLHVSLTDSTRALIGERELALMKKSAVIANTSRGEVVDQAALISALRKDAIFGAGLDVCTPEPLPVDDPLLKLSNCIVVPHIGSATMTARNSMSERSARNVLAGLKGDPLPFPVNAV